MMKISTISKQVPRVVTGARYRFWLWDGLARVPADPTAAISDLFVWRAADEWRTVFELLDVSGLIEGETKEHSEKHATFVFFDERGREFERRRVIVGEVARRTLDVRELLGTADIAMGTFACFHEQLPASIEASASHLAERGYVGYEWQRLGLRGYVHGNLDAVARKADGTLQLLGNSGLLPRAYHLQHELDGPAIYEFAMVNPTPRAQEIAFVASQRGRGGPSIERVRLPPLGSYIHRVDVAADTVWRLSVRSRLYMGRPVVFRLGDRTMDVFHG